MSEPDTAAPRTPVRVRVLHTDDRPVTGATVTVLDAEGGQAARGGTDDDGTFHTDVRRPGEYLLIAAAAGHEPRSATLTVAASDEHVVRIVLPGRHGGLTGVVSSDAGPLAAATVVVHDERGEVVATTGTDDGGRYAVTDLPPGVYTAVVAAPGLHPVTDAVTLGPRGDARWDPHLPGPVAAPAGRHASGGTTVLAGTARTRDGRPLPDARVALLNADGTSVAVVDTDADGRYTFPDLPAGDYTVLTAGYPPVADVLRIDDAPMNYDPVLGHPDVP